MLKNLICITFDRIASRLVFIPFSVGPRNPNGMEDQIKAEDMLRTNLKEAPRALGALVSLNMEEVMRRTKDLKIEIAEEFPEVDDRVAENYGLLLAMAEEVNYYNFFN